MLKRCTAKMLLTATCLFCIAPLWAQQTTLPQPAVPAISLKDALERARLNSPQFQSSTIEVEIKRLDRYLAKTSFYPTASYFNQYLYTQGNGTPSGVFVANDGVHVYSSQATVHQDIYAPARLAEYRSTVAAEAVAAAKRDVVLRGVVSAVFQRYYAIVLDERRLANARQSLDDARRFVDITRKLERGGEVSHSDVVKARLTLLQRDRDVQDARDSAEKSKIALAVLIFPGSIPEFTVVDDLDPVGPLMPFDQFETLAQKTSPDLRAARQSLREQQYGVAAAKSEYYPSFSFDYFFGINNNEFSIRDQEGNNRLGSAAQASLNIPINWWTTRAKVRQAEYKRQQSQLDVSLTLREFNASLRTSYLEAQTALAQLDLLRRTVDLAGESLRLTNLQYEAGEATVLEAVDAQTTFVQARNAYDDGLVRYRLALANIQTLTGNY